MMSIISQARFTSFSQKCVSMASWRHDAREIGYNYIRDEGNRAISRSETKPMIRGYCVSRNESPVPICGCPKFNTPKIYHSFENRLNEALIKKVDIGITCFSSILAHKDGFPPQISIPLHENEGHSEHGWRNRTSKFMPLLGLMGLFKGFTTSDIEDEREKLTDEQRVKKMKPLELSIARGVLAMCDQNYGKANELFHEALHLAQEEENEEQEMMILNLLASNYFESGDLEKAEKLFIDLMKRMIAHGLEPANLAILELSLKLASIYSKSTTTHDKATQGFKFVISNLLNDLQDLLNSVGELEMNGISDEKKDELALLGWSYDWFAKHLLAMNDYTGAADMLQRALQISSKVLGPLHDQTLILLNDVGTTLAMNDAPEVGRTFIKKAVEGAIESQSKELASFYVNLGLINLKLNKLNEAKRYCEYSIELSSKNREHHNSYEVIQLSRSCLNEVERLLEVEKQ